MYKGKGEEGKGPHPHSLTRILDPPLAWLDGRWDIASRKYTAVLCSFTINCYRTLIQGHRVAPKNLPKMLRSRIPHDSGYVSARKHTWVNAFVMGGGSYWRDSRKVFRRSEEINNMRLIDNIKAPFTRCAAPVKSQLFWKTTTSSAAYVWTDLIGMWSKYVNL